MKPLEIIAEIHKLFLQCGEISSEYVVDGGFFKGNFSLDALSALPSITCIGFEPNRKLCSDWTSNSSQYSSNIVLENLALGSVSGEYPYFVSDAFPATNSLLPRPVETPNLVPYFPSDSSLRQESDYVKTITLDEYFSPSPISEIFLLKLDLQGGELDALKGAKTLLESCRISIIYIEAVFIEKYEKQPLLKDLWDYLAHYDYRLHSLHDITLGDYNNTASLLRASQFNQCDALFLSSKAITFLGI